MIVEHGFFSENGSQLGVFGQGENFKLTTELSEKVQFCSRNHAIKNGLNEATLLMSMNEALLSR